MTDEKKEQDEQRAHRPKEQHQPAKSPDQPTEEVDLDQRDPAVEGRTNVDAHEPRPEDVDPAPGQAMRPQKRDAHGDDPERQDEEEDS